MARLPYIDPEEMPDRFEAEDRLPEEYQKLRHGTEGHLQHSPLLRSMGHNQELLKFHTNAFLDLWREDLTGLTPRERELVIITVGRTFGSRNEWNSHLENAMAASVTEAEILVVAEGDFDELDDKEATLLRYVEAMCNMAVTDDLHDELSQYYDDSTIVGLQVLTGYYTLCAVVLDAILPEQEQLDPGNIPDELGFDALIA